jgi:hypothetical protein
MRHFTLLLLSTIASIAALVPRALATKPTPPTEFLAVKSLEIPGSVELSWHAVKGVAEYTISASRETVENWHDLGKTTATHFQVNELAARARYYFRIASPTRSGQNKWSGAIAQYSAQTRDFRPALLLPTNFRVSKSGVVARSAAPGHKGELALVWNAVAGAKSYVVQICETRQCGATRAEAGTYSGFSQDELFRDVASVVGNEHLVTGLQSGRPYLFRIMGIDNKGQQGTYGEVQKNR